MSESGGAKFLRLLQALIEAMREGRLDWRKIEGEKAAEEFHARLHPADSYGASWYEGGYVARLPQMWVAFFPFQGRDRELAVIHEIHGQFVLVESGQTSNLFDDLCFLLTGGGDRQEALDAVIEAVTP